MKTKTITMAVAHGLSVGDRIYMDTVPRGPYIVVATAQTTLEIRRVGWLERIGIWICKETPIPNWLMWLLVAGAVGRSIELLTKHL